VDVASGSDADQRLMALSLAFVLVLAKLAWVAGRALPWSLWLPSALLWQDLAIGLIFAGLVTSTRARRITWIAYGVLVVWTAINIPIARTLSSPLTLPMLRATGGPLADSIRLYLTPLNVALILAIVIAGALLPRLRLPRRPALIAAALMLAVALPGPFVTSRIDLRGAERNAVTSVLLTSLPRVTARSVPDASDVRRPPFGGASAPDLAWLDRTAAGRNVVMIFLESTAAQYLHTYGASDDPMPTLTALAQRAIQFDAAYAVYPESIKGLFAVLCSRHPALDVSVEDHARAACAPLPQVLKQAGYQTAMFHSGRFAYLGMQAILDAQRFETLEDAGAIGGQRESSFGVDEPSTVARMLSWVDARDRNRPFFLAYLPIAGHHPYETPTQGPFKGRGELSAYENALRYADSSLATLIEGLRSRGLERNTLFVLFGDHGEAFNQHEGNFGHTFFAFEENVHVPLLIAIPGVTSGPIRTPRVASVVDIAPTVLALAGIPAPAGYEGTSLLSPDANMALFFTDYALAWAGLRDGCWKYLLEIEAGRSRLFDVCADPGESRDVAASHTDHVDTYRQRTLDWIAATRRKFVSAPP
jgi:hypothetical protein